MIVPFVFDMSTNHPYMLITYFNKFLNMVNKYRFPIIANERYTQKPSVLCKIRNVAGAYDPNIHKVEDNYVIPSDEDIAKAWKYVISEEFCTHIAAEHGGINNAFVHLISERDTLFEELLERLVTDILKSGKKITAFMTLICYPSLAYVAEKYDIKVIYFELGCFRKSAYRNTVMLSEYSLYSKDNASEMHKRYETYKQEAKLSRHKMLTNKQILSLFLRPDKLEYVDMYNNQPQYDLGCALGWSEDLRYMPFSYYNHMELLYTANKTFGEDNVLTRLHPGDLAGATYPKYIRNRDSSTNPIEFILKCKRVASVMSNVSIEAAFWGRSPYTFSQCPAHNMALHDFNMIELVEIEQGYLNWYALCWLFPNEWLFDPEYLYWRLSNPSELEIYNRHLGHYLKQDKLPHGILNMQPELSVKLIKHMRKLFGKRD